MVASIAPEETLADVLGARARRTPRRRLLLDTIGGVLIAAVAIVVQPPGWALLAAAAGCFAGYGCWAFSERHLHAAPVASRAWKVLWHLSAAVGLVAFLFFLLALLSVALGRMIS